MIRRLWTKFCRFVVRTGNREIAREIDAAIERAEASKSKVHPLFASASPARSSAR